MASVSLAGIRKVYDNGFVAVHDATFDIADGEFVVLVGPSGCGKSTMLRMIAGLESISAGELRIGDRIVNDIASSERDIAMVFQNYALYPHMSVYENMAFALRLRNESKQEIDRRVRDAAAILDIGSILDRRPRQLSGGQRQRVAVGRAIVRQPQVFLFDEPLSNLDAKLRVQTRKEIARLHRRLDATMIYVTHDQVEAMTMGDRIVVLNAGRIQQIGAPLELYEHPANQFVAGFIGSPAMNFIPGNVERENGRTAIRGLGGALEIPLAGPPAGAQDAGIVVGIRPEDIYIEGTGPASSLRIDTLVDAVEPMGNEVFLYLRAGSEELVARVVPDRVPKPEDRIGIVLDVARMHFFDAAAGAVIAGVATASAPSR